MDCGGCAEIGIKLSNTLMISVGNDYAGPASYGLCDGALKALLIMPGKNALIIL